MRASTLRYDSVAILLHWVIGIGIIVVGLAEILREQLWAKGAAPREFLKVLHEPLGLLIFALILVRILWRIAHAPPEMPDGTRAWEALAAKATHAALYALMIAVPVLGIVTTATRGRPVNFGLFQIPMPASFALVKDSARWIKNQHELVGELILLIALVHAMAAIWHHHVRKDDVLTRMMPGQGA